MFMSIVAAASPAAVIKGIIVIAVLAALVGAVASIVGAVYTAIFKPKKKYRVEQETRIRRVK